MCRAPAGDCRWIEGDDGMVPRLEELACQKVFGCEHPAAGMKLGLGLRDKMVGVHFEVDDVAVKYESLRYISLVITSSTIAGLSTLRGWAVISTRLRLLWWRTLRRISTTICVRWLTRPAVWQLCRLRH